MDKTDLSLPIVAPSDKGAREKGVVIGWFPFLCAEGKEFFKAHVRFDDGSLLHYVCDALVYSGDELSIGGRKFPLKKGEEFWIVRFRTEEHPGDRFAQVDTSNVLAQRRAGFGRVRLRRFVRLRMYNVERHDRP